MLGPVNLVALGIGAIIGAGLFSLTGVAAGANAGPAIVLSFIVAAIGCGLAGLCYSELASMIPVSGSAYTYAQATLGEFVAWIIGWDLVMEYAIGAATVSVSWSGHLADFFSSIGISVPLKIAIAPGVDFNLGAVFVICAVSVLLMRGIAGSAKANMAIVILKVAIVLAVIGVGVFFVKPANYVPFIPPNTGTFGEFGISGILRGAGVIFFAYIGFDALSTTAQEAKNPQKDMVWGIMGSLFICTVLYILFSLVLVGIVNYHDLRGDAGADGDGDRRHAHADPDGPGEARHRRRADLGHPGDAARPVAGVPGDVGGPAAAQAVQRHPSRVADAVAVEHPVHGVRQPVLRLHPDRGPGRDDVDRHPARLHHRLHGRHRPAPHPPRPAAAVPHPLGSGHPGRWASSSA